MAISANRLSAVCALLYRLLGSVCARATASTASGSRQGQWSDQPDRTFQLHLMPKSLAAGTKSLVVLKVIRQSHWCNLVLYPPLQRILTRLGLPELELHSCSIGSKYLYIKVPKIGLVKIRSHWHLPKGAILKQLQFIKKNDWLVCELVIG